MRYVIIRFEGRFAVLEAENCETMGIERARLPQMVSEGDVLVHVAGDWRVDAEETAARRERVREKRSNLWDG